MGAKIIVVNNSDAQDIIYMIFIIIK